MVAASKPFVKRSLAEREPGAPLLAFMLPKPRGAQISMTEPTLLSLIRQVRAQRSSQPDALEGERLRLEGSLIEFVEEAWPFIDAAPYQPNWASWIKSGPD